ncbi:hypothetical protein psyc5s11_45110 [Clostridium gelidum]|uniref:Phage abortive infection protein n=1 Tax=Clostridium gelidum TaxID=704125 RepID=A0ABN6J270_9CLOT|nr:hypothetical protein [Clostridium gelidum]BCZ48444.1 hypothetical protein psyc5s11_45110 [Clostridium gelidum]
MKSILNKYKLILGITFGVFMFLLVCAAIPFILDWKLYNLHLYDSHLDSAGWSSFNGSYIGAIIGGIATLLGVFITLVYTDKKNKESELQENSFIVYYDLYFAIKDLKRIYYQCKKSRFSVKQSIMFPSKEWNKNIAKLSGRIDDIKNIYELYGYLEQVSNSVKKYNDSMTLQDERRYSTAYHKDLIEFISAKIFSEEFILRGDDIEDEYEIHIDMHELHMNELDDKYRYILDDLRNIQKRKY